MTNADWLIAEGLISVFIKSGLKEPTKIIYRKPLSERDRVSVRSGDQFVTAKSELDSAKDVMLTIGSYKQSYFVESQKNAQGALSQTPSNRLSNIGSQIESDRGSINNAESRFGGQNSDKEDPDER